MRYPVIVPGLQESKVEVETAGMVSPTKFLLNGIPLPPGPKRGEFRIPRPDGTTATVQLLSGFLDHVPRVTVDGVPQTLAPPLNLAEKTLLLLPVVLVFTGGLIGGLCGGIAVTANMAIFRTAWSPAARYGAASGIFLAALVLDVALIRVVWPYMHPSYMHPVGSPAPYGAPPSGPANGFPGN